ncbi:hypothetical protein D7Z94_23855 [Ulvibacterium marinum]|uniref:SHOCT domain-containing protein n=1 Tax=Ulvibacterium marinum TaxID=2419782 RepID=A0A3B0BVD9_9FLAO|nr:hypothetical protein D7Z94_23855 [Ulvibacterium marinum]
MYLFSSIITIKVGELGNMLESGKISEQEYNKQMYLFKNNKIVKDAPLPEPSDNAKFKDK